MSEGRSICEDAEVVQDLRNTVVCEHCELMDSFGEKRVRGGWEGGWRVECGPGFGNEDLGALPDENCGISCQ